MAMQCVVYKASKKQDSYLFVASEGDFSRVPDSLLRMLGALELVMTLELSPERKLAQADVTHVMRQLQEFGYYLQLPPGRDRAAPLQ
jgi:uncharacterized protein YcgL (UPF0745 family)